MQEVEEAFIIFDFQSYCVSTKLWSFCLSFICWQVLNKQSICHFHEVLKIQFCKCTLTDHEVSHFRLYRSSCVILQMHIDNSTYALPFLFCLQEILNSAGFLASNAEKYLLGDIVATVKKSVEASPQMVCKSGSVQELWIYFKQRLTRFITFPHWINSPTLLIGTNYTW